MYTLTPSNRPTNQPSNFFPFQSEGHDVDLPGSVDLRGRPDHRLVRLPRRVPPLERSQKAKAPGRAKRSHPLVQQRHPRLPRPWQLDSSSVSTRHRIINKINKSTQREEETCEKLLEVSLDGWGQRQWSPEELTRLRPFCIIGDAARWERLVIVFKCYRVCVRE